MGHPHADFHVRRIEVQEYIGDEEHSHRLLEQVHVGSRLGSGGEADAIGDRDSRVEDGHQDGEIPRLLPSIAWQDDARRRLDGFL